MSKHLNSSVVNRLQNFPRNLRVISAHSVFRRQGYFSRRSILTQRSSTALYNDHCKLIKHTVTPGSTVPYFLLTHSLFSTKHEGVFSQYNWGADNLVERFRRKLHFNMTRAQGMVVQNAHEVETGTSGALGVNYCKLAMAQVLNLSNPANLSLEDLTVNICPPAKEYYLTIRNTNWSNRGTYYELHSYLGYWSDGRHEQAMKFKAGIFSVRFGCLVDITREKVLFQLSVKAEYLEYYTLAQLGKFQKELYPQIFTIHADKDFMEGTDGIYAKELLKIVKAGFLNLVSSDIEVVLEDGLDTYKRFYSNELTVPNVPSVLDTIEGNNTLQEEMFIVESITPTLQQTRVYISD
jgi:hypothetical protein